MDETIKYRFTGFQVTATGEEIEFPTAVFTDWDECLARVFHEMDYAISAKGVINGVTIIVYDNYSAILRQEQWRRGTI